MKHPLAARSRDWPASSFHRYVASGHYDIDWAPVTWELRHYNSKSNECQVRSNNMRFWSTSECDKDADKACTSARKAIERTVARILSRSDYGEGVSTISYIATILSADTRAVLNYPERRRFSKKDKVIELRLAIDHSAFFAADKETCLKMMCLSVLDGLKWASARKLKDFDGIRLLEDVEQEFHAKGWI